MLYTIVEQFNSEQMSTAVEKLLKDGWELHGSLVLGSNEDGQIVYAQALTSKQDPPREMSSAEVTQLLSDLLKEPAEKLSPAEQEKRANIIKILQGAAGHLKDKDSETE